MGHDELRRIDGPYPEPNRPGVYRKVTPGSPVDILRRRVLRLTNDRKVREQHKRISEETPRTSIDGRPELFETRVFRIGPLKSGKKEVGVFMRDPGIAAALLPVIKILHARGMNLSIVADGRALEMLQKDFSTLIDVTPERSIFELDQSVVSPDVILTDSSASDRGLEVYAATVFAGVPIVLVEDNYGTSIPFLRRLKEMELDMPKRICVTDAAAKQILHSAFPEIADRVVITGQPSFDAIARENTERLRGIVRNQLGIHDTEIFVSYMGTVTGGQLEEIERVAPLMQQAFNQFEQTTGRRVIFTFRRHPRDNTSADEYMQLLGRAGIHAIETSTQSTAVIGAASDIVITNWSVEGLNAILRRIPVLFINDVSVRTPPKDVFYPPPPVTIGAAVSVASISEIPNTLAPLLDPDSEEVRILRASMTRNYTIDGQSASRVANVVLGL